HLEEAEAPRATGLTVGYDLGPRHLPVLLKHRVQVVRRRGPGQVTDIDVRSHARTELTVPRAGSSQAPSDRSSRYTPKDSPGTHRPTCQYGDGAFNISGATCIARVFRPFGAKSGREHRKVFFEVKMGRQSRAARERDRTDFGHRAGGSGWAIPSAPATNEGGHRCPPVVIGTRPAGVRRLFLCGARPSRPVLRWCGRDGRAPQRETSELS